MSQPIPVWENNWKGWTSELCIKNGHKVFIAFCIGCGRPKGSLVLNENGELVEPEVNVNEEYGGVYEVVDDE